MQRDMAMGECLQACTAVPIVAVPLHANPPSVGQMLAKIHQPAAAVSPEQINCKPKRKVKTVCSSYGMLPQSPIQRTSASLFDFRWQSSRACRMRAQEGMGLQTTGQSAAATNYDFWPNA